MNRYKSICFEDAKKESVINQVNIWLADNYNIEIISSNLAVSPISVGTFFSVYILYREI